MITLYDWCFEMDMGCGGDIWRLTGKVRNHPHFPDGTKISPSTPAKYDYKTRQLTTSSGRTYLLENCAGNEVEQLKHVQDCIDNERYLIC